MTGCLNGGSCVRDIKKQTSCSCKNPWTGERCENKMGNYDVNHKERQKFMSSTFHLFSMCHSITSSTSKDCQVNSKPVDSESITLCEQRYGKNEVSS